jgi:polyhydroxyalkanoate synthesis regulator phasin
MGLITGILTLPLAPVGGTIALAEQIRQQAVREFYDPASIRLQLEEVDRLRSTGDLSDEEADALEDELVERLLVGQSQAEGEA